MQFLDEQRSLLTNLLNSVTFFFYRFWWKQEVRKGWKSKSNRSRHDVSFVLDVFVVKSQLQRKIKIRFFSQSRSKSKSDWSYFGFKTHPEKLLKARSNFLVNLQAVSVTGAPADVKHRFLGSTLHNRLRTIRSVIYCYRYLKSIVRLHGNLVDFCTTLWTK